MSDVYAIKTSTLTALGDAVRNKADYNAETQYGRMTVNPSVGIQTTSISAAPNHRFVIDVIDYNFEGYTPFYVYKNTYNGERVLLEDARNISFPLTYELDCPTIYVSIGGNIASFMEGVITITPLDEDGNEYKYTPLEMVEELNALPPMPSKLDLTITGDCNYRFYMDGWRWFIEKYGDKITTKDITNCSNMFYACKINIPFDINMNPNIGADFGYMFSAYTGTDIPKILNAKPSKIGQMFRNCQNISEIPEDMFDTWDWSLIDGATNAYAGDMSSLFSDCWRLKKLPMKLLAHGNPYATYSYAMLRSLASSCYSLQEIIDLPNPHTEPTYSGTSSANILYQIVNNCHSLTNFTFAPMEIAPKWVNQLLDFNVFVGWVSSTGIFPLNKEVKDDATYQALKNDPEYWSKLADYSHYNHDSAVRTINSLPDTTATGSNTIKFKGVAGSKTDGGAINTLTDEEIAVAAAKGWTVAFA
jgi:hypothetical protein